jgi:nucleotide-binding universal stress UspA family protein
MSLITRILCPTDFSDAAQDAFHYADRLGQLMQAEIVLAHAFDTPAELTMTGQTKPADTHLQEKMDSIKSQYASSKLTRLLHAGSPGEVICWLASSHHCDLIVMGTHGRTGLKHLVLGSVAEYVMRHASCPVLTLRKAHVKEPPPKEPLLLPVPAPRLM